MKDSQQAFEFLIEEAPKNSFELTLHRRGVTYVAGVDEVGRGCLAGPVVAAAVIFPKEMHVIHGLDDSKKLTPEKREALIPIIYQQAKSISIGVVDERVIDKINILEATKLAMKKAVCKLNIKPQFLLIDGNFGIDVNIPQKSIKKGDSLSQSIAAASIIAKVRRDQMMVRLSKRYPQYGFDKNKGYASSAHLEAIKVFGPRDIHRNSFSPIKELLE